MDFNHIEAFIRKVFNYYNGRINTINYPAILHIEWANLYGDTKGGSTGLPSNVFIYPMAIARWCQSHSMPSFYVSIIEMIIHELHHVDQNVDYNLSRRSIAYLEDVENAVEVQTALYMLQHQQEIAENFGVCVDEEWCLLKLKVFPYAQYKRIRYEDHLIQLINSAISDAPFDDQPREIITLYTNMTAGIHTHKGHIGLIVNQVPIVIQHNDWLLSIQELNRFFNDNCYNYRDRYASFEYNYQLGEYTYIEIYSEGANVMATYVDKGKEV